MSEDLVPLGISKETLSWFVDGLDEYQRYALLGMVAAAVALADGLAPLRAAWRAIDGALEEELQRGRGEFGDTAAELERLIGQ